MKFLLLFEPDSGQPFKTFAVACDDLIHVTGRHVFNVLEIRDGHPKSTAAFEPKLFEPRVALVVSLLPAFVSGAGNGWAMFDMFRIPRGQKKSS